MSQAVSSIPAYLRQAAAQGGAGHRLPRPAGGKGAARHGLPHISTFCPDSDGTVRVLVRPLTEPGRQQVAKDSSAPPTV